MKLEQIDTSTDEGKLEVMRKVIAEGRKRAYAGRPMPRHYAQVTAGLMDWNWDDCDYQIIAEPVGPDEVWVLVSGPSDGDFMTEESCKREADRRGIHAVRYVRADQ